MLRDICYYDGQCGLCTRSVGILRALDWLDRLGFEDMNQARDLPVAAETAMTGMPMRTRGGEVLVGFEAVRRALLQTPLGLPVALVLYVPGISHTARAAYRRIAANRRRNTTCPVGQGACSPDTLDGSR